MACSSVKWRSDEWRRRGLASWPLCQRWWTRFKQRRVEAHFDVRTEHDFTALTRDARNALDNPTSPLDLLDPLFLFCRSLSRPEMFKNNPDKFDTKFVLRDRILVFSDILSMQFNDKSNSKRETLRFRK